MRWQGIELDFKVVPERFPSALSVTTPNPSQINDAQFYGSGWLKKNNFLLKGSAEAFLGKMAARPRSANRLSLMVQSLAEGRGHLLLLRQADAGEEG